MNEKKTVQYMSFVVLLSVFVKFLGLARQIAVSSAFGMTGATDVFHLVSVTLNDLEVIFFSGLPVVYLTAWVQTRKLRGDAAAHLLTTQVLSFFLCVSLLIVLPFELFPAPLLRMMAPGLPPELLKKAVLYLRILAAALPLFCVRNVMASLFNAENAYWYEKSYSVIQSLCVIGAVRLFGEKYGIDALIPVLMAAYGLEAALGLFFAHRNGYYRFGESQRNSGEARRFGTRIRAIWNPRVRGILLAMVPLMLSNSVSEINALIDRAVASSLGEGTLTEITYAQSLNQFVVSILISSTLTVLFTAFARDASENAAFGERITRSSAAYAILLLPASIVAVICAEDIVSIVYRHGAVTAESARVTAWVLRGYGVGFLPLALRGVLLRAYYSVSNTRAPLSSGLIAMGLNAVLTLLLSRVWGAFGVALATSAASLCSFLLLGAGAAKHFGAIRWKALHPFCIKACAACAAGVLAAYPAHSAAYLAVSAACPSNSGLAAYPASFLSQGRAIFGILAGTGACFGAFFGTLYLLRCAEFYAAARLLIGLFRRKRGGA